jgi:4-aminobutyrate aminotransferase-like enzyme
VSCAAASVVLDTVPAMRAQSEALGARLRSALEHIESDAIGEVRGLGPMLALEFVRDRESKTPAPERAAAVIAAARAHGLLLLGCGLHGNVIRLLPPLTIGDDDLARGLEILEACIRSTP